MNSMVIKVVGSAILLMVATVAVLIYYGVDLSDPVNIVTLVGAAAVAVLTAAVATDYISRMKTDTASGELAEENWDGIGEYKNELPVGWAYTFLGVFVWTLWYGLLGYPVFSYSQVGEYNKEVEEFKRSFERKFADIGEEELVNMGESIYLVQCAPCHGNTGDGNDGMAQDLTKRMSKEQILHVIEHGQNQLKYPMGAMPPMTAQGEAAEKIATWIVNGAKGTPPPEFAVCAGCHGADGKGNGGISPNIVEYDEILVAKVLEHGKKGVMGYMPAFKERFAPVQQKAIAAYLKSLSSDE